MNYSNVSIMHMRIIPVHGIYQHKHRKEGRMIKLGQVGSFHGQGRSWWLCQSLTYTIIN